MPNGDLVAGGDFITAGGVAANGIARWDGTAQTALGAGIGAAPGSLVLDLEVLPDGDLIAAGQFVFAGDFVSISLARWTDAGIPQVAQEPAAQSIDTGATLTLTAACAPGYGFNGAVTSVAAAVTIEGACPADLTGDGAVGGDDLALLLSTWGSAGGDIDGDGTTGAGDLALLLGAWGACG